MSFDESPGQSRGKQSRGAKTPGRRARRERREGYAEKRGRLAAVDDPAIVFEAALRFLEPRQRAVDEVRRRLTSAGYQQALVEGAIVKLLGLGILDDATFAQAWVESRDRARPRGERALRRELQVKGIDRGVVDGAMELRRPDPGGEADPDVVAAERLMLRHRAALARIVDPRKRRARAYALLARNGFDSEIASSMAARSVAAPDLADDGADGASGAAADDGEGEPPG
jgi:regulatory protein